MNLRGSSLTERTTALQPPMTLDKDWSHWRTMLIYIGSGAGLILIGFVFGQSAAWTWPGQYEISSSGRLLWAYGSAFLACLLIGIGLRLVFLPQLREAEAQRWRREWHNQTMDNHQAAGGVITEREFSEWELSADTPGHVIWTALSVHRRAMQGTDTPWSVRHLEGPVLIGGLRVGELNTSEAREMPQVFAQLGLIAGRGQKKAGEWVPQDEGEVIDLIDRNWRRVGRLE